MVRVKTLNYTSEALRFSYIVNVNKQGLFTTTIPQDIVAQLKQVGIELNYNRNYTEGFFSSESLDGLIKEVEKVADKYSEKELIEEKIVIQYRIDTNCHYCKGNNGKLYPDGYLERKGNGGDDYHWVDGTKGDSPMNSNPFGFEVFFKLKKVKVWRFPNGELNNEYCYLIDEDCKTDNVMEWLNSVRHMGENNNMPKEIDYSPELGMFFKKMTEHIFMINENIRKVFGEELDLKKIDVTKLQQLGFNGK